MPGWVGYHRSIESGDFECKRCGWHGRAQASVVGRGRATLLFDKPEKALVDARVDAVRSGAAIIRRARCKRCGERNPNVALWFWLPYVIGCAAAVGLGYYWMPRLFYPLVVLGIPYLGWRSLKKGDAAIEWIG